MYSKAELFIMATNQAKEIFVNNVTLSAPDDVEGCLDLDAEKVHLSKIWEVANMKMAQMVQATGLNLASFARRAGIPYTTLQGWCYSKRECPVYVRFLLAEHYGLI